MAYTFNYTTIGSGQNTTFTDELKERLLAKMVFEGRTAELVKVIPGVKRAITLNLLANSAEPTAATCGWTPNPSNKYVGLDQKELTVLPLEVKDAICPKDFEQLYLGMYMRNNKEVPFEELIADSYVNKVKNYDEKLIWDGDTNGHKGLLGMIDIDANVIDASGTVSLATNTAIDAINALLAAATPDILMHENKVVFTSYAMYNAYASELRSQNLYMQPNYQNGEGANYEMYIPGTDIRLVAIAGMDNLVNTTIATGYAVNGVKQPMILTYADNIVLGTDMLNDEEMFDMWYSRDNDEVRVNIQYKLGWNFYFGDHIVKGYKL